MAEFSTAAAVRDYLQATATTGQWSNAFLGSNMTAASDFLQKRTGRLFETFGGSNMTKVFSTHGKSYVTLPDFRGMTTVVLDGATLTRDETVFFITDRNNSGVFVGMEFPQYRQRWYPGLNIFDVNYTHLLRGYHYDPEPNNLSISGNQWGHSPYPAALVHATNVLAGWLTLRVDANLAGIKQTPEGNIFDLSALPAEVQNFILDWQIHPDEAEPL